MSELTSVLGGEVVTIHVGRTGMPDFSGTRLGLDVESSALKLDGAAQFDPKFFVRTVQLATETEAWILDLYDPADRAHAEAIFANEDVTFCSHTPMDVLAVWNGFGIDISGRNIDTRMLAIEVDPGKFSDRDLKALATAYGMPELAAEEEILNGWMLDEWHKEGGKKRPAKDDLSAFGWDRLARLDAGEMPSYFWEYGGLDAIACRRLLPLLSARTGNPFEVIASDVKLQTLSNRITIRGHLVDQPRLVHELEESGREVTEAKAKALEISGVNIAGPKLVPWLETQGMDWSAWEPRTKTGAPSLEKDNPSILLRDFGELLSTDALATLEQVVRMKKYLDTYNKARDVAARIDARGRIHPELNPIGATTTARMSSSRPNMQNFSKKNPRQRGLLLFDPGTVGVSIDFAQIELRVTAALAREDRMIETILAGGDLHQLTVDELAEAGVTITRATAKIVNFLIVYGGGPKALHEQTGIPIEECKRIVYAWRSRYPAIQALAEYQGLRKDEVRTISNRRLPVTTNSFGEARSYANINYLVQSSARDLLVTAWLQFERKYPERVWWPIHDELILQLPEDGVDEMMEYARHTMSFDFMGVPITADPIKLIDEEGTSRWMTGDEAERIAKEKVNA